MVLPTMLVLAVLIVSLVVPRTYVASGAFVPQQSSTPLGNLAGIASQFGVNLLPQESGQSPDFYVELLGSNELLRTVARSNYELPQRADTLRGNLAALYSIRERDSAVALEKAVARLRRHLSASAETRTGIVHFRVEARSPKLAHALAVRLLDEVNSFNLLSRRSRAGDERKFLETRVEGARQELRAGEDELQRFLQANRVQEAPALRFQRERLQREITLRQQVFSSLVQAYEQARIEEVRSTPVVTVLEHPYVPPRPESRMLGVRMLFVGMAGLAVALLVALVAEFVRLHGLRDPMEVEGVRSLLREASLELRRPLAHLRRRGGDHR